MGVRFPPSLFVEGKIKKMKTNKKFVTAVCVIVGTAIGAGVLGIPYVAVQAGFFVALAYILLLGGIILLCNLYLGEISLRTKGNHQLPGYARKYLGKKGAWLMQFAMIFGIYSAILAYMVGIGGSLSFLIFGNVNHTLLMGFLFGILMSLLLWKGISALKKFEKIGVGIIFLLLAAIIIFFIDDVKLINLSGFNFANIFLPFGVILFAFLSFSAVPEVEIILKDNEKLMKKVIVASSVISIIFYALFTFMVVGFKGNETPEIATLTLGAFFIVLGIFTMFTSHLALGNALKDNFVFDSKMKKFSAWFFVALVPIFIFLITQYFNLFSFTKIISIGGSISGGLTAILIFFMLKKAKKKGNRKPEYSVSINWWIIGILSLIFIAGVVYDLMRGI